ncbi:hypothetical protein GCM10017562_20170 [Streptomyces roseofulvus]
MWVKVSQTTCVAAPSAADPANARASPAGRRPRHGRPRTTVCTGPRHRPGNSPTSGSRTVSQSPTRTAARSTSTVTIPAGEWVTSPNSIAPGTTVAAK